jgi:hypothetical protein
MGSLPRRPHRSVLALGAMNLNELSKRRSFQLTLGVFSIVLAAYCIHGFIGLVRQTHTRALEREFAAAVNQLEKRPPGIQRAENFVSTLKKIDRGYSPPEVKKALQDYIAAFQQSLDALKAGRDTAQYDPAIAEARERLITSVRRYD